MRPPGSAAELERRRRRAVELVAGGEAPAAVGRILGVDRSSIYRWRQRAQTSADALSAKPHPGRTPLLSAAQLMQLETLLCQGAQAHGWPTDLWTAERVTRLIRRRFRITFHPEHVRKMLRQRLGWTSQKPQRRARERNEPEIERWQADEFPRIVREAWQRQAQLIFLDESGFQLTPCVRRTRAPRGPTPIHRCWDRRDRISAIRGITCNLATAEAGWYFNWLPDNVTVHAPDVVSFLRQLRQHVAGPLTVIWDRSTLHDKSWLVRAFLAEHPEIVTEKFPGYAPELNPDELVWGHTKYGRVANLAAENTRVLRGHLLRELNQLRSHSTRLQAFINPVNLPLRL
jgi:transposase